MSANEITYVSPRPIKPAFSSTECKVMYRDELLYVMIWTYVKPVEPKKRRLQQERGCLADRSSTQTNEQ